MSDKVEVIPNILSVFKHPNHDYWAAEYRRKREDGKWSRGRPIHFQEIKTKEGAVIEAMARYNDGEFDKMFPAGTKRSRKKAEDAVRELIRWAGDNPDREGLKDTPRRVARAFEEFFAGYWQNPDEILATSFSETGGYDEMVALTDIPFESHCEHHMVPFVGMAHVAYIPDKTVVGISKLARLVDLYAKRLQIQEKMTTQIADTLQVVLNPLGVGVVIEATHMCMTSRGIKKKGVKMKTSRMLGAFKDDDKTRREFLSMIGGKSDTGS